MDCATDGWAEAAEQALAEAGYRRGGARRAMLELLDEQACALSAIEIEALLRSRRRAVSRASIYRILEELERLRLIQRVKIGQTTVRYEPVRAGGGHHHHLICDCCGTLTPFIDADLELAIERLSGRVPLTVSDHEVVLRGACADCAP